MGGLSMSEERGNPHWGKPHLTKGAVAESDFDRIVRELRLVPEQYASSNALRDWACKNKDSRYVPLDLLKAWGFTPNKGATRVFLRSR